MSLTSNAKLIPTPQTIKPAVASPTVSEKPKLTLINKPKFFAYTSQELRDSIVRKEARKAELLKLIAALDEKLLSRKQRLQELSK
ncbi:hypothetical protein WDW86_10260 [Bdellovibrionota bacterium FG-2]